MTAKRVMRNVISTILPTLFTMFTLNTFAPNFVDGQMPDTFLNRGAPVKDIKFRTYTIS